ncbi:hypothetical protein D8674_032719 [Pyrus ussuriensis x Pyrus communis]|uniref:Uncharacterized protein n=1 Tax=Pyrus ussuriensis x Pyrus communis TaxID=2448454 RepID=A0A5N5HX05_9ROSA|nr:hypothetical protein D8674_032719 [Pyrus ussuriensis x Pyrus communis]
MAPLFPNARRQLFCNTSEHLFPTVDHEVLGPMMRAPTNNTATPVPTQENLVPVLTAIMKILIFGYEQNPTLESGANQQFESPAKTTTAWGEWNDFSHGSNMLVYPPQSPNPLINIYCPRYDEAAKNVILKDEHFPSDLPGFGVNVIPPWSNEIGYMKHGSSGKHPCINGDTDKLMTSGKQPSISGDTVKIISSFFSGDSYRFDPIEICNAVHFDSDSDCTSTARTRHPQIRYKAVKECAACEYVGGQEHCDWMNRATGQTKQEAIPKDMQNAKSPSDDAYGKKS